VIPGATGRCVLHPSPPPVVGGGDDNDVDWVARGLSSSGDGSIVASTLRWSLASLSPSGGDRGGGREARRIPSRGEEDEYRGPKLQGGVDEARCGREEEKGGSGGGWAQDGVPGSGGELGRGWRRRWPGTGRLDDHAADAPPSRFGEGGLSSRHLSIVVTRNGARWLGRWGLEVEE
jgi:hypothetical protein